MIAGTKALLELGFVGAPFGRQRGLKEDGAPQASILGKGAVGTRPKLTRREEFLQLASTDIKAILAIINDITDDKLCRIYL